MVSKVFKKLVNNRIVDHLEKCGLFSDFQFGFKSSWSTADFLAEKSDSKSDRSGATQAVAIDISKAFDRVCHACLLHKLMSYGISGQIFGLIFSFLSNRWLWVVLDWNSSREYLVNAGVPQGSIRGPTLFLLLLMTFLIVLSVILLSMLMILLSTLNVIRCLIVATTRIGFWTWIWSTRYCGIRQEVPCWFKCWKNSACFIWPV